MRFLSKLDRHAQKSINFQYRVVGATLGVSNFDCMLRSPEIVGKKLVDLRYASVRTTAITIVSSFNTV